MASPEFRVPRIVPTPDGGTVWQDLVVSLPHSKGPMQTSDPMPCTGVVFRQNTGAYDYDFHRAPREQYVVSLSGLVEITTTDGTTKTLKGGEPMYVEDVVGRGHKSRAASSDLRRSIFVCTKPLPPGDTAHGRTVLDLGKKDGEGPWFPLVRIVPTEDGGSAFVDSAVPLSLAPIPNNNMSVVYPALDVVFAVRTGDSDFHTAPRKHIVIILTGTLEIETTAGESRRFGPGDVFLAEDVVGRGHRTRAVGGECASMWMKVGDGVGPSF
ncbi:hypothetical protein DFJ74DRAFT_767840 [Hyaloraphidium curvatum]|nr:hypothetical protein DFJ74DRAFT_767840 [Hyaloraphidium curvatum]